MSLVETGYKHIVIGEDIVPSIEGTTIKGVELVAERTAYSRSHRIGRKERMQHATRWALLTLTFLSPLVFCPWSYDSFELPKLLLVRMLIAVALAGLLFAKRKDFMLSMSPLHAPVLVLFGVMAIATAFSAAPSLSVVGTYQHYGGLLEMADMVLLYFLAAGAFSSLEVRRLFAVATAAGTIMAIYGIAQHFGGEFGQWNISEEAGTAALKYRSFATLASPSFLGLYLAMVLPLGLAGATAARGRWSRIAWRIALALMTICLVFTYSRAAWLGIVIGIAVWVCASQNWGVIGRWSFVERPTEKNAMVNTTRMRFFATLRRRTERSEVMTLMSIRRVTSIQPWWGLVIIVCAAVVGSLLAPVGGHPSALERASSIVNPGGASAQVRLKLWRGALNMVAKRPALGWGPDMFRFIFPCFAPQGMTEVERRNVSAHNDFLDRAAQMGLIGVAVYLWLLVIAARVLRRALKAFDQNHRGDVAALGASLVAYLFAIQFGFSSVAPMALWWLLLGCLAGIGMRNAEFRNPNSNPPPAPPPTPAPPEEGRGVKGTRLAKQNVILISLTLVWVTLTGWTLFWFIADVHFQRGEIAWKMGDKSAAVTELERAVAWRPGHDFYLARLGQLQEEQRNDGTDYYHAAVRANPVNAANHALLATALQTAGQDKAALEEWRTTVALDPQWAQAHNALGMLYHKLADDSSAIEAYHRAIEIEPEYAAAYNNLGNAYLSDGKIEQALACYQRALSL